MSSPSLLHEAFLLLFRNRPELAPELLRDVLDVPLPAYAEAKIESADLTQVTPTEYRADLVVLLVDGKPVLGIVVEAQLRKDDGKKYSWPVYVSALRARLPAFDLPRCHRWGLRCGPQSRTRLFRSAPRPRLDLAST